MHAFLLPSERLQTFLLLNTSWEKIISLKCLPVEGDAAQQITKPSQRALHTLLFMPHNQQVINQRPRAAAWKQEVTMTPARHWRDPVSVSRIFLQVGWDLGAVIPVSEFLTQVACTHVGQTEHVRSNWFIKIKEMLLLVIWKDTSLFRAVER